MSYNIGQLRGSSFSSDEWKTDLIDDYDNYSLGIQKEAGSLGAIDVTFANRKLDYSFSASDVYYLKFSVVHDITDAEDPAQAYEVLKALIEDDVKTEGGDESISLEEAVAMLNILTPLVESAGESATTQNFTLQLELDTTLSDGSETVATQELRDYTVLKSASTTDTNSTTFEIIFQPNSSYERLVWDMTRNSYDFLTTSTVTENDIETEYTGRIMNVTIDTFAILKNINPLVDDDGKIQKLGLQSLPGTLFTLDGEEMRIGKSGIYEMHHDGVTISYFGIVLDDGQNFILDYKYGNTDDVSITNADTSEDEEDGNGTSEESGNGNNES